MTLEELLQQLDKYQRETKLWLVNPKRQKEFTAAYHSIREMILAEDENAIIECSESPIDDGSMSICVTTYWLTVREIEQFWRAINKANNFEVYPIKGDKVRFNILFEDMMTPISKK